MIGNQSSQNYQMEIEQTSNNQPASLSNLQKFLNNYNKFISDNISIELNTQNILNDIALNVLEPPTMNKPSEHSQDLHDLYVKGKRLPDILDKQEGTMQQMTSKLKKLKQDKVYETIMYIEQLHYKLTKEYEQQVNRGIQNGVYNRKVNPQGANQTMVGIHKTQGFSSNCSGQYIKINPQKSNR